MVVVPCRVIVEGQHFLNFRTSKFVFNNDKRVVLSIHTIARLYICIDKVTQIQALFQRIHVYYTSHRSNQV